MTRLKGIDAAARLTTRRPEVRIPCLTAHTEPSYARAMLTSGASGYLNMRVVSDVLVRAVRVLAGGQSHLCRKVAATAVESMRAATHSMRPRNRVMAPGRRGCEVRQLVVDGQATAAIANKTPLSLATIETHRRSLRRKHDRRAATELSRLSIRVG